MAISATVWHEILAELFFIKADLKDKKWIKKQNYKQNDWSVYTFCLVFGPLTSSDINTKAKPLYMTECII